MTGANGPKNQESLSYTYLAFRAHPSRQGSDDERSTLCLILFREREDMLRSYVNMNKLAC
jgi:hypothetical protein